MSATGRPNEIVALNPVDSANFSIWLNSVRLAEPVRSERKRIVSLLHWVIESFFVNIYHAAISTFLGLTIKRFCEAGTRFRLKQLPRTFREKRFEVSR